MHPPHWLLLPPVPPVVVPPPVAAPPEALAPVPAVPPLPEVVVPLHAINAMAEATAAAAPKPLNKESMGRHCIRTSLTPARYHVEITTLKADSARGRTLRMMSSPESVESPASLATVMGWLGPDRRVHPRVPFAAEAKFTVGDRPFGTYTVQDISVGGALVVGDLAPAVGQRVHVALTASELGTVQLEAQVVRVQRAGGRHGIGIMFCKPPSLIARMIEDAVLNELSRAQREGTVELEPRR
jgi:hypothetical protein